MLRPLFFLFLLSLFLVPSVTWADDTNTSTAEQSSTATTDGTKGNDRKPQQNPPDPPDPTRTLWGIRFGVGIGFTRTFGRDRIETAINDNGIVRIDGEKNAIPRVMLELHKLHTKDYWCNLFNDKDIDESNAKFAFGPFFAIQPGTGEIIQSVTGGIMGGFRTPKNGKNPVPLIESLNIGLGISVEPNSKTLGDGLQPNQPVPSGVTVRTQTRSLVGVTIMVSVGF